MRGLLFLLSLVALCWVFALMAAVNTIHHILAAVGFLIGFLTAAALFAGDAVCDSLASVFKALKALNEDDK